MSQNVIAAQKLFLTADKSALVGEEDGRAAFLYATPGHEIPAAEAERFGLIDGALPGFDVEAALSNEADRIAAEIEAAKKAAAEQDAAHRAAAEDAEKKAAADAAEKAKAEADAKAQAAAKPKRATKPRPAPETKPAAPAETKA